MNTAEDIIRLIEQHYAAQIANGRVTIFMPPYNNYTDKYIRIQIGVNTAVDDCGECVDCNCN